MNFWPGPRLTQRFPVSAPSLCCSKSLFESLLFLRFDFERVRLVKIGAEFLLGFEWIDNRLSSSSSDDDCRWRFNVLGDNFSLLVVDFLFRFRRLTVFDTWRILWWDDDDDACFECVRFRLVEFVGCSSESTPPCWSSLVSNSGSLRRLLLLIDIASSALNFAWRSVGCGSSSSRNKENIFIRFLFKYRQRSIRLLLLLLIYVRL
jgi:hypothetical protein